MAHAIAEGAREARALGSSVLRRASLALVAALLAAAGVGFLLAAAYLGLARHLGPEGAGVTLGAALLACAAGLFLYARRKRPGREPVAVHPEATVAPLPNPVPEGELAPLATFVAAFVLARQLRRRQAP